MNEWTPGRIAPAPAAHAKDRTTAHAQRQAPTPTHAHPAAPRRRGVRGAVNGWTPGRDGPVPALGGFIGDDGGMLDDWIAAVKSELGIDLEVDVPGLLDMTRDVAHGVARPAAPLTAFLVGYAAAQAGGGPAAVAEANRKAAALAVDWSPEGPGR